MSLLMEALKKAERAKRSGLQEPEAEAAPSEPRPPAREPYLPEGEAAPRAELSLEPLEPPIEAAREAVHDPVPPQARHEVPHHRPPIAPMEDDSAPHPASGQMMVDEAGAAVYGPPATEIPAIESAEQIPPPRPGARSTPAPGLGGAARAAARPPKPDPDAARRAAASATGAFAAQGAKLATRGPARARTAADAPSEQSGFDVARLRIAGLSGVLVLIAGIFGYVYWKATVAPGPGAGLPMVPMPPPSATGATGIVVTPGAAPAAAPGQYEGAPGIAASGAPATPAVIPGTSIAAAPAAPAAAAPVPIPDAAATAAAVPAPAAPSVAPAPAAAVPAPAARTPAAARRAAASIGPTPAQLAAIADPAMRQDAMHDAAERAERVVDEIQQAEVAGAVPPAGAAAASATLPAAAGVAPATVAAAAAAAPPPLAGEGGEVRISRSASPAVVSPSIESAYAAFQSGDLAKAREQYQLALGHDPTSRDALLGLAAVSLRENQGQQAAATYLRLLELDATDADALAGLVGLRAGDMSRSETRLKELLRRKPESGALHFALGNLYAKEARWTEAQQSFFRAYTATPNNPDYAFNLAIGLDRLNQPRLAASYYQRALLLAQTVPATFDRNTAQRRLQELGGASATAP
ncbi:tetratricopeptide repeat protein [Massilia endophytica]|uniref:tetratricopeptide repeat protein n=1 Tax=Massilia endophytica TaxID=2899220 RepID=UPI001E399518|nr:tetratricopeptide repeat protein [Massilia endophytica]UGQ48365.1 tetratricopeptide repeat protein [Massilia endophytica]